MDAVSGTDGDGYGVAGLIERRKSKSQPEPLMVTVVKLLKESQTKKSRNNNSNKGFKVVRCISLFPGDINDHFPSPMNSFHNLYKGVDYPYEIKHTCPPGMKNNPVLKIVQGMPLEKDVVSLLSNGGKRDYLVLNNGVKVPLVDSLSGKYLCICCFAVPIVLDDPTSDICRAMIETYSLLKAANNHNFEMVMVAKMTSATMVVNDDEEATFNHFFSAFPCLAIPFSDVKSREFLCYSLGFTTSCYNYSALVLDPDQMVLQTDGYCFIDYGAAGFPFTTQRLDALDTEDDEIKLRLDFIERESYSSSSQEIMTTTSWLPVSLEELLGGSHLLCKSGCKEEVISVSELSKKKCTVRLYLCYDGTFLGRLKSIQEECEAKNLKIEIVLVYLPFSSDKTSFEDAVKLYVKEMQISSWWFLMMHPTLDAVIRRLWRFCDQLQDDNLIVLAEDGRAKWEMCHPGTWSCPLLSLHEKEHFR